MSNLLTLWKNSASSRAVDAWRRIQDKPTSITLKRGAITLSAQTVRVELSTGAQEQMGQSANPGYLTLTIFGIKGHPTLADTDMQRGDRMVLENTEYEVVGVLATNGEIQAYCEARQS